MTSICIEQLGEEIRALKVHMLMDRLTLCQSTGKIWRLQFSTPIGISVESTQHQNIEDRYTEHIFQE